MKGPKQQTKAQRDATLNSATTSKSAKPAKRQHLEPAPKVGKGSKKGK